jgi:hypothetical protein
MDSLTIDSLTTNSSSINCLEEHRFNITCIICMGNFVDPVLGSDGVVYCEICIKMWNEKHEVNPRDNGPKVTNWIKSSMLDHMLLGSQVFTDLNLLKLIENDIKLDGEDDALKILTMIDLENNQRLKEDRSINSVLKKIFSNYKLIQQIMDLISTDIWKSNPWAGIDEWNIAHYVARFGTIELIELMINNYDFDLNKPTNEKWLVVDFVCCSSTCLSSKDQLKLIKLVLNLKNNNIDFNAKNQNYWYPIQTIICNTNMTSSDCIRAIEFLINNNVNEGVVDDNGWNLLHYVFCDSSVIEMKDCIKIVNLAIKNKNININHMNKSKNTPLHFLCIQYDTNVNTDNFFDLIKVFIDNGVDVNMRNNTGSSPLHLICKPKCNIDMTCRLKIIKLFMDHSADPLAMNQSNKSSINIVLNTTKYTSDEKIKIIKLLHPVKKIE